MESHAGDPIISLGPSFTCHCPRALAVLATATVVGLLTGFLGVGGGFLVVPALVLALGLPMAYAAGTSLVVITLTSASAPRSHVTVRVPSQCLPPPPSWACSRGSLASAAASSWYPRWSWRSGCR